MKSTCSLLAALTGVAIAVVFFVTNNAAVPVATAATATALTPDPYDLPSGTEAIEVSWEGYIRSAVEHTSSGSRAADIRAYGDVRVDGSWRSPSAAIQWDDLVELGAIYNAGSDTATISFESGFIIDIEPGDVLFVNNLLSQQDLWNELSAAAQGCTCTCTCQVPEWCGDSSQSWECSQSGWVCEGFSGNSCTIGQSGHTLCTNTLRCSRRWNW